MLTTLVESIFSSGNKTQNELWPTDADWAVIDSLILDGLRTRVNNTAYYTFPYIGRSLLNGIATKLKAKSKEFAAKGGERTLSDEQIQQIIEPIITSIIEFVRFLGRGLHSPQQPQQQQQPQPNG